MRQHTVRTSRVARRRHDDSPPVAGFLPSQACIGRGSPVCLNPTRHAPHAAMAAATLGVAASAALDPRPPWSGTIRQATDQLVLATTSKASNARNIGVLCVSRQLLGSKASSTYSGFMPPPLGGRSPHLASCSRSLHQGLHNQGLAQTASGGRFMEVSGGGARSAPDQPSSWLAVEHDAHVEGGLLAFGCTHHVSKVDGSLSLFL